MRIIRTILILTAVFVGGFWLLSKMNLLPSFNLFKQQPVVIDKTPILIKEIKSIGQLITYSSFDEVVANSNIITKGAAFVDAFNRITHIPLLPPANKQLVLIGRGKIVAGVDLGRLADGSIHIVSDTVFIKMPPAQIFDAILNPADFETFVERGNWNSREVTLVKIKARRQMIDRALRQNILPKAANKAKQVLENFLLNLGYKKVVFQ